MKEPKPNAHSPARSVETLFDAVPPPAMSPPSNLPVDKTAERLGFSPHETPVWTNAFAREEKSREEMGRLKEKLIKAESSRRERADLKPAQA